MKVSRSAVAFLAVIGFGSMGGTSSALAAAGDLDPDFGVDGKVTTDFTGPDGEDEATVVLRVDDDEIVVVGFVLNPDNDTFDFALARYDEDGNLDTSFGTEGRVVTDFGGTNEYGPPLGNVRYVSAIEGRNGVPDLDDYVGSLVRGEELTIVVTPARKSTLRPGIVLSLVGGPFFLGLLLRRRREVSTW